MKPSIPIQCVYCLKQRPIIKPFGRYYRISDSKWINRYRCLGCRRTFSRAYFSHCFGQKKRRLNAPLLKLLCSGVSLRRSARILKTSRRTVTRKLIFLSQLSENRQSRYWKNSNTITSLQFDDLETSIHSKCKPLSITLAVIPESRKIVGMEISTMPAKGHLAKIALKKYGFRKDERPSGIRRLLQNIRPYSISRLDVLSDQNPIYPSIVKSVLPQSNHRTVKGRRGCVVGQGELKKIGFDPLFSLNHTCAMLRANINRLARRTWCTTKKIENLRHHLMIYRDYHNRILTPSTTQ